MTKGRMICHNFVQIAPFFCPIPSKAWARNNEIVNGSRKGIKKTEGVRLGEREDIPVNKICNFATWMHE